LSRLLFPFPLCFGLLVYDGPKALQLVLGTAHEHGEGLLRDAGVGGVHPGEGGAGEEVGEAGVGEAAAPGDVEAGQLLLAGGLAQAQHGQAAVRHLPAVGEGELAQLEGNRGEEGTTAGTGAGEAGTCGRYWVMYLRATSDTSVLPRLNFLRPFSLDFLSIRPGGGGQQSRDLGL